MIFIKCHGKLININAILYVERILKDGCLERIRITFLDKVGIKGNQLEVDCTLSEFEKILDSVGKCGE